MRYPAFILVIGAAVAGFIFSAVSTYDSVAHLDRQIHGIHCSYLLGMGASDVSQESGCYATMMSPYSSVLRQTVWGGIPVALPGMSVFAFIVFIAVWMMLKGRTAHPRTTGFLALATALPVLTSIVMGFLSIVTLETVCKVCMGIYISSITAFGAALFGYLKARKHTAAEEGRGISWKGLGVGVAAGGLFILLPVIAYGTVAPDFTRYIGNCGTLDINGDADEALIPVGPQNRRLDIVEVMDPLCAACGMFEQRFRSMPDATSLNRKLLLFPLDNACNWMVDEAIHPGACAVSEAIICANENPSAVLDFAFENQSRILEAAKADLGAPARIMAAQFPGLARCIGSAGARAKLNLALRFAVKKRLQVLTPQIYVAGLRLCDEDTDLGLEYALPRLIARAGAMPPTRRVPAASPEAAPVRTPRTKPKRPKPTSPMQPQNPTPAEPIAQPQPVEPAEPITAPKTPPSPAVEPPTADTPNPPAAETPETAPEPTLTPLPEGKPPITPLPSKPEVVTTPAPPTAPTAPTEVTP